MSNFFIVRKDQNIDPIEIESEGLTIGRLAGNDLSLNHPTVSRTHAGIKEISGDYWIFNLSEANGTLLNGELIEQTPLADGDLIQVGPFFIFPKYTREGLQLDVEVSVVPVPVDVSNTTQLQLPQEETKTVRLDPSILAKFQRSKPTPKGTIRLSGEKMLTGRLMPVVDAETFKVFWDKRKREAGKLSPDSPLAPTGEKRHGKAQFNWYPTRDLQSPWTRALFTWSSLLVALLAISSIYTFKDVYSSGTLSVAHARSDFSLKPEIATKVNANSCTTCHSVKASMVQNCAECHTTKAFQSGVSEKHTKIGLKCIDCHTEHQGRDFRVNFVANVACTGCHRDDSGFRNPLKNGELLKTPHGGGTGYPVTNGTWSWQGIPQAEWERKELPGSFLQFTRKEQFHLVHIGGRQEGRTNCTDCHINGFEGAALTQGVRQSCANCHGIKESQAQVQGEFGRRAFSDRGMKMAGSSQVKGPLCISCHTQHGEEKNLRASLRRMDR